MERFREVAGTMSMLTAASSPRFRAYEMVMGSDRPERRERLGKRRRGSRKKMTYVSDYREVY